MVEYRNKPKKFAEPTEAEIRARSKRNFAIAAVLLIFVGLVFFTMVSRGVIPSAP